MISSHLLIGAVVTIVSMIVMAVIIVTVVKNVTIKPKTKIILTILYLLACMLICIAFLAISAVLFLK